MVSIHDEKVEVPNLAAHAWRLANGNIEVWCEDGERHYFTLPPGITRDMAAGQLALLIHWAFRLYENAEAMGEKSGVRDTQYKLRALLGIPEVPRSNDE